MSLYSISNGDREAYAMSESFERLKQELLEKDQMITELRQKLEWAESFAQSAGSCNLGQYGSQGSSSIMILAEEEEEVQSPVLRLFGTANRSHRKASQDQYLRRPRFRSHTGDNEYLLPLDSPDLDSPVSIRSQSRIQSLSMAILPTFKQVIPKIFHKKGSSNTLQDAAATEDKPRRSSFFRSLFSKDSPSSNKTVPAGQADAVHQQSKSTADTEYPEICYDDVLARRFEAESVDLDRIERYLTWEDCITYLGVTKDQLALMRSASIEAKKRPVFLTRDQLRIWPLDIDTQ